MIGNELQVAKGSASSKNIILCISGVLQVLVGSLATILYPKARDWYNRNKKP